MSFVSKYAKEYKEKLKTKLVLTFCTKDNLNTT